MIRFSACLKNGYMKMINQQVEDLLRNALDALEYHTEYTRPIHKTTLAIEAIKQALEQPAKQCNDCNGMGIQDGKGDKCLSCDGHGEQPASKPNDCARSHPHENMDAMCELRTEIARLTNENARLKAEQEPVCDKDPRGCWSVRCQLDMVCKNTSPPSKPWVSLSDMEITRMSAPWFLSMYWSLCNTFARAIEAKLKEKNGY